MHEFIGGTRYLGTLFERSRLHHRASNSKFKIMLHLSSYQSNGLPTVVWSNKVNLIGEKVYKPKIHFCEHCNKPILIYGRLIPCKHVFCFSCATICLAQQPQQPQPPQSATIQQELSLDSPASNNSNVPANAPGTPGQPPANSIGKGCHRCGGKALRVERNMLNSIFVCQIETCRRTYLSARDLQAHVNHRHSKNKSNNNHNGTTSASIAAISSSPYISSSSLMHLSSHSNNNNSSTGNNNNQSRQSASSINHSGNNNYSPSYHNQQHHNRHERDHHQRNRDRDRFKERDNFQRDRERERDSKEYHRQSIQRAAQWAEASAQMMEKGFTR